MFLEGTHCKNHEKWNLFHGVLVHLCCGKGRRKGSGKGTISVFEGGKGPGKGPEKVPEKVPFLTGKGTLSGTLSEMGQL